VQERAAPDVGLLGRVDAHGLGQPHGHLGDAPGMPLGLLVPQVQRPRPAFNGFLIGET